MTETAMRIPIERIEADGKVTKGTARMRGVTIDDFQTLRGAPMELPPGAKFVIPYVIADAGWEEAR